LIEYLYEAKADFLMRVREKFGLGIDGLGLGDHEAVLEKGGGGR
jgi:hypothetical protein